MSLVCPKCKKSVGALNLRESFVCSNCSSKLAGKYNGAFAWAFILSALADFIIYPIVYLNFGTNWWPGVVIRCTLSASIFAGFLALFSSLMGTIEVKNDQSL